jgi:hypothetical protein
MLAVVSVAGKDKRFGERESKAHHGEKGIMRAKAYHAAKHSREHGVTNVPYGEGEDRHDGADDEEQDGVRWTVPSDIMNRQVLCGTVTGPCDAVSVLCDAVLVLCDAVPMLYSALSTLNCCVV